MTSVRIDSNSRTYGEASSTRHTSFADSRTHAGRALELTASVQRIFAQRGSGDPRLVATCPNAYDPTRLADVRGHFPEQVRRTDDDLQLAELKLVVGVDNDGEVLDVLTVERRAVAAVRVAGAKSVMLVTPGASVWDRQDRTDVIYVRGWTWSNSAEQAWHDPMRARSANPS